MNITTKLSFIEYQQRADSSNQFKGSDSKFRELKYGLFGEIGGVLSAVKKAKRDNLADSVAEALKEELGDALWYMSVLASEGDVQLDVLVVEAINQLLDKYPKLHLQTVSELTSFSQLDGLISFLESEFEGPSTIEAALCTIGAKVGLLLAVQTDDLLKQSIGKLLSEIFAQMVIIAAHYGLHLNSVAQGNLSKIESRWTKNPIYIDFFDKNFPEYEQLPRDLEITFIERASGGVVHVVQQCRGLNIGDRLTDNRMDADFYRFHDVFHLAYMVHLGWSPVMRGLFKLKRKSDPAVDENEDGARAMIIEEAVSAWVFNNARTRNFFADVKHDKLEYSLLKQLQSMVSGYEVDQCPLWQWENAIVDGFKVFNALKENRTGVVKISLSDRTITYNPLPKESLK